MASFALSAALFGSANASGLVPAPADAAQYRAGADSWSSDDESAVVHFGSKAGTYATPNAIATVAGDPFASVYASVTLPDRYYRAIAYADLTYYFTLSGTSDEVIPLQAFATGYATAYADVDTVSASLQIQNSRESVGQSLEAKQNFSGTLYFSAYGGSQTMVHLRADASLYHAYNDPAGASGVAYFDPYITIDPDFAAHHPDITLTFSTDVVNAAPNLASGGAPEPATWTLAIMGFGLAGAALRRGGWKTV